MKLFKHELGLLRWAAPPALAKRAMPESWPPNARESVLARRNRASALQLIDDRAGNTETLLQQG
jgi:hypothetical protein